MNFREIEFLTSFGRLEQLLPSELPEIAFSGHSNVGKSSMINRLFERKNLARTSSQPGKTATINFFAADGAYIVDLPGYGYARRSKEEKESWGRLMEAYFGTGRDIALTVQIIDFRHEPTADDYMMLDFLQQTGMPFLIARTKGDKLKPTAAKARRTESDAELARYAGTRIIDFSSVTGAGVKELRAAIEEAVSR